ncbi:recombinase RecB [Tolypothrix sp. PCC 7910]|uniref:recombinase RecB n=1 Tax=Tolypothrix sp. PCC 7910 TaxID=2099387 RepID=UPI0014277E57|nr:recombinase RecB [Tolypothrix sp. PCC 7910]QIR37728.1 recombinase RecB [Tolypothrix sp. PCC 7910]
MLVKNQKGWIFAEEYMLEDFLWNNLENTLGLIPLKRQFGIKGEYCDIIAKTTNNQLVILELKNCEDRYIIQQLTRYYHSLSLEQPFNDIIDYSQPIRLIAIAPDFHRHNFIDRRYSILKFEFVRFTILKQDNNFYLHLYLEGRQEITIQKPIPFIEIQDNQGVLTPAIQVDKPPRILINFLDTLSPLTRIEVLRLRDKMLGYDQRIREIKDGKSIFYGRGKTKPICQLKLVSRTQPSQINYIQCYLWLPIPTKLLRFNKQTGIGRMYINFEPEFQNVKSITYWTPTSRYASALPMAIDIYLDEIGLDKVNQNVDRLIDLAIKLNLERN